MTPAMTGDDPPRQHSPSMHMAQASNNKKDAAPNETQDGVPNKTQVVYQIAKIFARSCMAISSLRSFERFNQILITWLVNDYKSHLRVAFFSNQIFLVGNIYLQTFFCCYKLPMIEPVNGSLDSANKIR